MENFQEKPTDLSETDYEAKIDALLGRFPDDLQKRYEGELEGALAEKTSAEQLSYLSGKYEARKQAMEGLRQTTEPEHIPVSNIVPQTIEASIERSNNEKTESFLGDGQTAEVLASMRQPTICYKVFFAEQDQIGQNTLVEEIDLQIIAQRILSEKGWNVPEVYAFIRNDYGDAIMMEKVPGASLRHLMNGRAEVPENFNLDEFIDKTKSFIKDMNDEGIYHRDLTPGNIMVGEDGEPWIIDFGRSKKTRPDDPDAYTQSNPQQPNQEMVFPNDKTFSDSTLKDFRVYIESR